jgi:hypothetical protein
MFKGINCKTLLDTPEEWHALVIGFCEALCPWPPRIWLSGPLLDKLLGEYHYYMAGRGVGFVALLLILAGIAKFILEVLL